VGTPQSAHVVGAIATPSSVGRWIRFDSRARVRSIDRAIDPPRESRARASSGALAARRRSRASRRGVRRLETFARRRSSF
jgi:hypothetical protein